MAKCRCHVSSRHCSLSSADQLSPPPDAITKVDLCGLADGRNLELADGAVGRRDGLPRLVQYGTNIANMGGVQEIGGRNKPTRPHRSPRLPQQARRPPARVPPAPPTQFLAE